MAEVVRGLKAHLILTPQPWAGCHPIDQAAQSLIQPGLEHPRQGASTASLDSLYQCLTTLCVKHVSLTSNLKSTSFSLMLFPLSCHNVKSQFSLF